MQQNLDYPYDKSIVDLVEERVLVSPEAIAVVYENHQLSYKELNERSNQLARYLIEQGMIPEALVPICVERSLEMIVGILGILKAGGAYVPIDPTYPADRINYMLKDTEASLVVSSRESRVKLQNRGARVITLDCDWPLISRYSVENIPTRLLLKQLAYVIYTSGSTGKPKGVMIEHKSLVASTLSRSSYYPNAHSELLIPSYSFDSSVATIFGTLSTGGKLILCKDELIKDADHIKELIKLSDSILCVPSYYNFLLEENLLTYSSISRVILAGEKLDQALVAKHYHKTVNVSLYNEYGPTENTVWATVAKITPGVDLISIGKPINNVTVYILDEQNNFSPIGVEGELHIGGMQIARGYLNCPDLTVEHFIKDPFSMKPGSQMYKTGDLGRWLPDGNIEYLGRRDDQVKVRGYRIEPGEIENVLHQSGFVHQSVVLAKEDSQGTKRLVGYIVAKGKFDRQIIVSYLTKRLPDYMIPGMLVMLEHLPLTPNGKVDKKALLNFELSDLPSSVFVAPWSELEKKLAGIWQALLGVERVGMQDNFFELGGYSLLAIRLTSRIREELNVNMTVMDLFVNPTIAELARSIDLNYNNKSKSLIPLKVLGNKTPLYIICGAGGTVFAFQEFAAMLDPNQPVYGLQLPVEYKSLEEFPDTIEGIAATYIKEILLGNPNGPYALSGHCLGGFIALEMAMQLGAMGKKVTTLAMFDTVVSEVQKIVPPSFTNFYRIPTLIKKSLLNAMLKINFELFLLINHPQQALRYKVDKAKLIMSDNEIKIKDMDKNILNKIASVYVEALRNYEIKAYKGEILVFYAKEHYYFVDRMNRVFYKSFSFSNPVKNAWKRYAELVKIYEVEGEHSVMFDPKYASELACLLQQHLDLVTSST